MRKRIKPIALKKPNVVFLIADDWSYPHAGAYGDPVVRTPTFDRLANEGALFNNAYCASPSCSPSRASILTGRYPHQLEGAGNLWSVIPDKFPNWVTYTRRTGLLLRFYAEGLGSGRLYYREGTQKTRRAKDTTVSKNFLNKDQRTSHSLFGLAVRPSP